MKVSKTKQEKRAVRLALAVVLALAGVAWLLGGCASAQQDAAPIQVSAPTTGGAQELTAQDVNAWLDGVVPSSLSDAEIPGAFVTVVKDGQILTTRGYGYADIETRTPVTKDTVFRVASVSKIPVAIGALQLIDQGKLDLEADISTYVDVPIDRQFDEPITIRNLLTHTAGFEERFKGGLTYGPDATWDLEKHVLTDPPAQIYAPGTTIGYSNYGINLLGYIIQEVSGLPFEQYMDEYVFGPAGMDSSTFAQPQPAHIRANMATGYSVITEPSPGIEAMDQPAGAMATSGEDAGKFMIAQLDNTLLSPAMKELAWTVGIDQDFEGARTGMVYFLYERNGHPVRGHGGDSTQFHSDYEIYPEENTGIFVSMNATGQGTVSRSVRNTIMQGFADRYYPVTDPTPPLTDEAAKQRAEDAAGSYIPARGFESTFMSLQYLFPGGSPTVTATGDGAVEFLGERYNQTSPGVWTLVGGSRTLALEGGGTGERLLLFGIATYVPATAATFASKNALYAGIILLLFGLIAWPVGALRKQGRLTWVGRTARLGALVTMGALAGWVGVIPQVWEVSDGVIRLVQVMQGLGALAIIPAAWSLINQIRTRAGWAHITASTVLLLGLTFVAIVVGSRHGFSPDISY